MSQQNRVPTHNGLAKDIGLGIISTTPAIVSYGTLLTESYYAGKAAANIADLAVPCPNAVGLVAGIATFMYASLKASEIAEGIEDPATPFEHKLSNIAKRWFGKDSDPFPKTKFANTPAGDVFDAIITVSVAGLIAGGLTVAQYGVEKAIGTSPTFNSITAPQPSAGKPSAIPLPNGRVAKISDYKPSMA